MTEPVQVSKTVSPSLAAEMALLTADAEQSLGPTVIVAAHAGALKKIKLAMMVSDVKQFRMMDLLLIYDWLMQKFKSEIAYNTVSQITL